MKDVVEEIESWNHSRDSGRRAHTLHDQILTPQVHPVFPLVSLYLYRTLTMILPDSKRDNSSDLYTNVIYSEWTISLKGETAQGRFKNLNSEVKFFSFSSEAIMN